MTPGGNDPLAGAVGSEVRRNATPARRKCRAACSVKVDGQRVGSTAGCGVALMKQTNDQTGDGTGGSSQRSGEEDAQQRALR
jgi:hypothetical protein